MVGDEHENPVLENLYEEMKCGIFTNPNGEVLIVHDQPIQSRIEWVEYDQNTNQFALIHENGKIQDLGIELDQAVIGNLSHAQEVTLSYLLDKKIKSSQTVVLLVKDY